MMGPKRTFKNFLLNQPIIKNNAAFDSRETRIFYDVLVFWIWFML